MLQKLSSIIQCPHDEKKYRKYLVTTKKKIYLFIIKVSPNIPCPDVPDIKKNQINLLYKKMIPIYILF